MAKIAVSSCMEHTLFSKRKKYADVVFIVGKGNRSEDRPVLMPAILQFLREKYDISGKIDDKNTGRIRVTKECIENYIEKKE